MLHALGTELFGWCAFTGLADFYGLVLCFDLIHKLHACTMAMRTFTTRMKWQASESFTTIILRHLGLLLFITQTCLL